MVEGGEEGVCDLRPIEAHDGLTSWRLHTINPPDAKEERWRRVEAEVGRG